MTVRFEADRGQLRFDEEALSGATFKVNQPGYDFKVKDHSSSYTAEIPIKVGIVGGPLESNPTVALNLRLLGVQGYGGNWQHMAGANARAAVNEGRADYVPVFLSDVPELFSTGVLPLDAAFINVTPPDGGIATTSSAAWSWAVRCTARAC